MASYLDNGLLEPMRAALAGLQADAPPMSTALAAGVIEAELGQSPEQAFAWWDPTPTAAASIGQVHRARTHDGTDVAVKVQYPGVDDAIRADLGNLGLVMRAVQVAYPGLDSGPLVAELRARLSEELDYRAEAAHQRRFAAYFRGHPCIHVSEVIDRFSTRRVLTTEWADGVSWESMLGWSQDERDLVAETMFRFSLRRIWDLHAFNGNPHPGNYLFSPGGRVTFLDFGMVKTFSPADTGVFRQMIQALVTDDDIAGFRRVEEAGILPGAHNLSDRAVADCLGVFTRLMVEDGHFRVDGAFATELVRRTFATKGTHGAVIKAANLPAPFGPAAHQPWSGRPSRPPAGLGSVASHRPGVLALGAGPARDGDGTSGSGVAWRRVLPGRSMMITVEGQRERSGRPVAAMVRHPAGAITTFVTLLLRSARGHPVGGVGLARRRALNPRWQPARQ